MISRIVFSFWLMNVSFSLCFGSAPSDGDISLKNRGGGIKVEDRTADTEFESWRQRRRSAEIERRREIEKHNRQVRELRRWIEERRPVHEKLLDDIRQLEQEREEVISKNAERHSQLQAEIARGKEALNDYIKQSQAMQDQLSEKLKNYSTLKDNIEWGAGDGSDRARFERAVADFLPNYAYGFATNIASPEGQKLADALEYRNRVAELLDPSDNGFGKKAFIVSAADKTMDIADKGYVQGEIDEGDFALEAAKSILDVALGLTPGVGWGKDVYEAVTGKNLVTGYDIDMFERSLAVLGAVTVGVGSIASKALKALNVFKKMENAGGALKVRGLRKSIDEAQKLLHGAPHVENTASALRKSSGNASISKPLYDTAQMMRGSHGNAGLVPEIIGKRLEGREFNKFDDFREAFWIEIANSKYATEFGASNIARMKEGNAPFVAKTQVLKAKEGNGDGRRVYELHHIQPISHGGSVYDVSNIMITTPRFHKEVLTREYHGGL